MLGVPVRAARGVAGLRIPFVHVMLAFSRRPGAASHEGSIDNARHGGTRRKCLIEERDARCVTIRPGRMLYAAYLTFCIVLSY